LPQEPAFCSIPIVYWEERTVNQDRMHRRRAFLKAAALAPLCAAIRGRAAAAGPRSLQIVVPTAPGTQPDLIARWLAEPMARSAGVPGLVVNRPGAAGAIAADAVLAAPPESGALLLGGLDHVAYSHLNSNRRALDPLVDFVPVGAVNRDTWIVVVPRDAPARTLSGLAERSRKAPLRYASTGEGTTAHLLSERLCAALGIAADHVPYRDAWMPDLVAGRVDFVAAPTPTVLGQLRAGRLHAVATLTDERLPVPGEPPSVRELGFPDQVFHGGLFLFAPAAARDHAPRLNAALVEALAQPEIAQRFADASIAPLPLDLAQTAAEVRRRLQSVDVMRLAVFGRTR
jgi:tripartite-type tricarboxylate transporter receptor subunit TctC